jgi:hypothetical protein
MANEEDRQGLDAFASEDSVPPPRTNEIDALVDAVSTGSRPRLVVDHTNAPTPAPPPHHTESGLAGIFHARALRWSAMVVVSFALGATLTWGLLQALDPAWIRGSKGGASSTSPAASASRRPSPVVPSPPHVRVLPNAARPIMIDLAPDVGRPAATTMEIAAATPAAATPTTGSLGTVRPDPASRSVDRTATSALGAAKVTGTDSTLVVPGVAAVPTLIPSSPVPPDPLPPASTAPVREAPAAAAASAAISSAAIERNAVLHTLRDYEEAYQALDVQATAAVWPSVDRRALARAFATVKSQGLAFDQCDVQVTETIATARCRGTLQYVRKVGSPVPRSAHQEWLFRMRKLGSDWKIDGITASEITASGQRGES